MPCQRQATRRSKRLDKKRLESRQPGHESSFHPFNKLPAELQIAIYRDALCPKEGITIQLHPYLYVLKGMIAYKCAHAIQPPQLAASRAVSAAALPIIYGEN